MREEATIVSMLQLDIEETVTVYLFLPPAQLVTLPNTPTFIPGDAVVVLTVGVVTTAQPPVLPPVLPPPPPLPFWPTSGTETKTKQTNSKAPFIKWLRIG